MIHPEAIEATERLYNAWSTGRPVKVLAVINSAVDKARKRKDAPVMANNGLRIIHAVCQRFGVTEQLLKSKNRTQRAVWPRWLCCLLIRELDRLSTPEIGRLLKMDHSGVLYAIRCCESRIELYPDSCGRDYRELKQQLTKPNEKTKETLPDQG